MYTVYAYLCYIYIWSIYIYKSCFLVSIYVQEIYIYMCIYMCMYVWMSRHLKFVKGWFDELWMSMLTCFSHGLIGSSSADHLVLTENGDGKPNENGTLWKMIFLLDSGHFWNPMSENSIVQHLANMQPGWNPSQTGCNWCIVPQCGASLPENCLAIL